MTLLHQVAIVSAWLAIPLSIYGSLTYILWCAADPWDRVTVLRVSGALFATIAFWLGAALGSGGCGMAFLGSIVALPCAAIAIAIAVRLPRTSRAHRFSMLAAASAPVLGWVLGLCFPGGIDSCP